MSDNQTMKLEYQFTAEDINVSTVINRMEASLKDYTGEIASAIIRTNKMGDEMLDMASASKKAESNIKSAASAIKHLNNTNGEVKGIGKQLADDINRTQKLTRELNKQQKTISELYGKSRTQKLGKTDRQTLSSAIKEYQAGMLELQKMDSRMASGLSLMESRKNIAYKGLLTAKHGSEEEKYLTNKARNAERYIGEYNRHLNQASSNKNSIMNNAVNTEKMIESLSKQYKDLNIPALSKNLNKKWFEKTQEEIKKTVENIANFKEETPQEIKVQNEPKDEPKVEKNEPEQTKNEPKITQNNKKEKKVPGSSEKEEKVENGSKMEQKEPDKEQKRGRKTPSATINGKTYHPPNTKDYEQKIEAETRSKKEVIDHRFNRNEERDVLKTSQAIRKNNAETKNAIKLAEKKNELTEKELELKSKLRKKEDNQSTDNKIKVDNAKTKNAIDKENNTLENNIKLKEKINELDIEKNKEQAKQERLTENKKSKNRITEENNKSENRKAEYTSKTDDNIRRDNNTHLINEQEAEANHYRKLELMSENTANQIEKDNNKTINSIEKMNQAHSNELERIKEKTEALKESNESYEKLYQSKGEVAKDIDNTKTENKKGVLDHKLQNDKELDDHKLENKKLFKIYSDERNELRKLQKSREELIPSIEKQADAYKKMEATARVYRDDLDNISQKTDAVVETNAIYSDSFDKVEKSLRKKEKSLVELGNNQRASAENTKKLIESSKEYMQVLEKNKASIEAKIQKLESLGTESIETSNEIERLKNDLKETDSTMDSLKSATNRLLNELDKAGVEVEALGNDFNNLENKIDSCKSSVSGFGNKMATVGDIGSSFTSGIINASEKTKSFGRTLVNTGQEISNIGREMQFLSLAGAGVFASAISQGMDYEGELANVRATLNTVGKEAGYADEAMDKISERVREVSSSSIYSPTETMEMAKYLSLAGYDLDKILSTIEPMSQLMSLTDIQDAAEGVDLLTDSFASLGLGIKKANESDVDFAKRFEEEVNLYMDTLAKMQSVSNQNIKEGMSAYIYAGGEFDRLNIPLEQSGALLSVLASRGLKSAEAGRGLSSTLINLTKETGQSYEALKELNSLTGIDVFARFDSEGNYKLEQQLTNITEAFDKIYEIHGKSKGAEIVNRLTGGIAGKTQIKTFTKLLEGYGKEYTEIRDLLSKGTVDGSMDNMMEEKTKSIEYKYKMMIASIQESLVSLFDVIKPYVEKAIEVITQLSDAFRNLSSEDKLELAKLVGLVAIIPVLIVVFGTLVSMIGNLISAFATVLLFPVKLAKGFFILIKAAGRFLTLVKGKGLLEGLILMFPKLEGFITSIYVFISDLIAAFASGGILGGLKSILLLGAKIVSIMAIVIAVFSFFKDLLSNWEDLGFFGSLEHAFINLVNLVGKYVGKIISLFNEDWGKAFEENFANFESSADKYAKEKGYDGYDEMKKQQNGLSQLQKQANDLANGDYTMDFGINFDGFDGITGTVNKWSNGAIGRLIEGMNNGSVGEVSEDTVSEYKESVSDVVSQYEYIQNLKKQGNKALEDENKLTKKMLKTREKMSKHSKDCADYIKLQGEYNDLYEQKKQKTEFRIANQEELDTKLKEYEENALVISVKYEEAKKNGLGDEFIYENLGEYFQQEFGIELVFKNKEESVNYLNKLKENLPELKQGIELEIDTAEGDYKNQLIEKLAEVEKLELAIPVALEIMEAENKLLEFLGPDGKLTKAEDKVLKIETDMAGVEEGSKAWKELSKQHKEAKKELEKVQKEYDSINKTLEELETKNPQIFSNAVELAKILAENPGLNLVDFLTGDNYSINGNKNNSQKGDEFINQNYHKDGKKKTEEEKQAEQEKAKKEEAERNFIGPKPATKKQKEQAKKDKEQAKKDKEINDYVSQYDYVNPNGMPMLKPYSMVNHIKERLDGDTKEAKDTVEKTTIDMPTVNTNNSTPITDNTKKDLEGANEALTDIEFNKPTFIEDGSTPITDNVKDDVENTKSTLDELQTKAQETLSSFGEIDMSNLVEVFSVVLALADEVRQRIIDIANVANNYLKNCLTGSADGLFEKLAQVREQLINIGNVANNYVRNSISGMLDGFLENIGTAREAVINLGNVANNYLKNCLNGAGEGLKTSLQSAREVLLSICNVALNRGVNSMQSLGDTLTTALNGARDKLLSICNVALFRGQSAMTSMGDALSSSLSSALSIVNRVASVVDNAVRKANTIKIPTIPSQPAYASVASFSAPDSLSNMLRGSNLTNSSSNTINTSSSSFNFAIDKVITNSNTDLKNTARRLTTYCKRRGLF